MSGKKPPIVTLFSAAELDQIHDLLDQSITYGADYGEPEGYGFDNNDGTYPVEMTCFPVEGASDMFVIGTDGKIYFSQTGLERYNNGVDVDWWGVVADLSIIVGGAAAGVGAGVVAIIGGLLGIAGATLAELIDLSNERSNDD